MHAERFTTPGAFPLHFFFPDEFFDALISDIYQVFDDTQPILCAVSFIQPLKSGAGELFAGVTELGFGSLPHRTVSDLAIKAISRFVQITAIASITDFVFPEADPAQGAI